MRNTILASILTALATVTPTAGQAQDSCSAWTCRTSPHYGDSCCFEHHPTLLQPYLYVDPCAFGQCGVWGIWSPDRAGARPTRRTPSAARPRSRKKQWERSCC